MGIFKKHKHEYRRETDTHEAGDLPKTKNPIHNANRVMDSTRKAIDNMNNMVSDTKETLNSLNSFIDDDMKDLIRALRKSLPFILFVLGVIGIAAAATTIGVIVLLLR